MTQNVPENKLNLLSYLQSNPLQINKKMQLFRAKQNFKTSLKNARILYLFFEILLGSEQLQINIDDGNSLRILTCMWWESGVLFVIDRGWMRNG